MKEIECFVSGKVQGVNFRSFVKNKASGLWLTGSVENTGAYGVKVIAQGNEERLNKLIEHLHKGPFTAKVSNVSVTWRESTDVYDGFKIQY